MRSARPDWPFGHTIPSHCERKRRLGTTFPQQVPTAQMCEATRKGGSRTNPGRTGRHRYLGAESINARAATASIPGELGTIIENPRSTAVFACLLYTSDAADDLLCVDLGGR